MYVVEYDWLSVARSLGKAHIPGNYGFEDLRSEEAPQIGRYLLGQGGSVVIHGKQNTLDREGWVDGATKAH
jgi:hypothetical protein